MLSVSAQREGWAASQAGARPSSPTWPPLFLLGMAPLVGCILGRKPCRRRVLKFFLLQEAPSGNNSYLGTLGSGLGNPHFQPPCENHWSKCRRGQGDGNPTRTTGRNSGDEAAASALARHGGLSCFSRRGNGLALSHLHPRRSQISSVSSRPRFLDDLTRGGFSQTHLPPRGLRSDRKGDLASRPCCRASEETQQGAGWRVHRFQRETNDDVEKFK